MHSSGNEASHGVVEMRSRLQAQLGDSVRVLDVLAVYGKEFLLRAHDVERDTDVILRALSAEPGSATKTMWHFERMAERAAGLEHPNILAAGPLQRSDELVYYVVADVKTSTIESLLADPAPLPLERAFAILRDIASALDYAHGEGVVHGHLEPLTITLRGNDIASVSDFGAANGAPTSRVGRSSAYMAPEQWQQDAKIDGRADIYALGVIAFELISGRRRSVSHGAHGIAIVDPLPVTHGVPLRSGVGLHVNQALLRAVAKRPLARFATAGEFIATLQGEPQTVVQGLPTERPELLVERNPHFALVPMALVAALGITVGAMATPSARQALHRFGSFWSIPSGFDLRIPELPAFSDAPLARQGGGARSGSTASTEGGASSGESLFPGAATAAGTQASGGPTTVETPELGATRGGSLPLGGSESGGASSTFNGAVQPSDSPGVGVLRVDFDGQAALVMIDEVPRGRTPFIGQVQPGAHSVRLVGSRSPFPIQQVRVFAGDTAIASFSTKQTTP